MRNDASETDTTTQSITVAEGEGDGGQDDEGEPTDDGEPTEDPAELLGFGAGIAIIALLAAALITVRRTNQG